MQFAAIHNEETGKWLRSSRRGWDWWSEPTLFPNEEKAHKTWNAVLAQERRHIHRSQWYQDRYEKFIKDAKIVTVSLEIQL